MPEGGWCYLSLHDAAWWQHFLFTFLRLLRHRKNRFQHSTYKLLTKTDSNHRLPVVKTVTTSRWRGLIIVDERRLYVIVRMTSDDEINNWRQKNGCYQRSWPNQSVRLHNSHVKHCWKTSVSQERSSSDICVWLVSKPVYCAHTLAQARHF